MTMDYRRTVFPNLFTSRTILQQLNSMQTKGTSTANTQALNLAKYIYC